MNLAGKVNCWCFDKTGTLTSDGLELCCIRPTGSSSAAGSDARLDHKPSFTDRDVTDCRALPARLTQLLATCHSLTHVGDEITGDPLEVKTFAFTGELCVS